MVSQVSGGAAEEFRGWEMSEGRAFCFDNLDELQDAYIQLEKVLLEEREDYGKLEEENRQLKEEIGEGDIWQES